MENNELYHYGILGMKWGVRKDRGGDSSKRSLGNRYRSASARRIQRDADDLRKHGYVTEADAVQKVADKQKQKATNSQRKADSKRFRTNMEKTQVHEDYARAHSKKSVKTMSDAELRNRINRLQMEKQYKELSGASVNKGKKFASRVLKDVKTVNDVINTGFSTYSNVTRIRKLING